MGTTSYVRTTFQVLLLNINCRVVNCEIINGSFLAGNGEGEEVIAFPPPKGSNLRKAIDTLRQERHIAPRVIMAQAGTPQASYFDQLLVEEGPDGTSFAHFLNSIASEVSKLLAPGSTNQTT